MKPEEEEKLGEDDFFVTGLGASAGGLDPLKIFFSSLPEKTEMAFIVVVHLSPDHESNMARLLQAHTSLTVLQVNKKTEIRPDHVYVIPPKKMLSVKGNYLVLRKPDKSVPAHTTIDLLFSSLAESKAGNSIGIILSGSASDGVEGLKKIKEHGGLAIVQDPSKAEFRDMPRNAINTGIVDMVLPVEKMAAELLQFKISSAQSSFTDDEEYQEVLNDLLKTLHSQTGHDFSNYKQSSILRRIDRRMHLNRIGSLGEYYSFLKNHPDETNKLFKNLLISVTSFFRDPEAFEALAKEIIPRIFQGKEPEDKIRVWIPGCATGEEAYSVAITLHEHIQEKYSGKVEQVPNIQIFATDIDEHALKIGRRRKYLESIEADVSQERLDKYFNKTEHQYEIKKTISQMVLFAQHNLLRDPPFTKLDLIVCRNLLIYLNKDLQAEVFNLFHYSLKPNCWLFLGISDSRHKVRDMFSPVNKELQLYQRNSSPPSLPQLPDMPLHLEMSRRSATRFGGWSQRKPDYDALHLNLLLKMHSVQSAMINEYYEVVHSTDGIKKYLSYEGGKPSLNILEMIKPHFRQVLRKMLFQAEEQENAGSLNKIRSGIKYKGRKIEISISRIDDANIPKDYFHVVFKEKDLEDKDSDRDDGAGNVSSDEQLSYEESGIVDSLIKELEYSRGQLQYLYDENETSTEKLKASNEELQSMNEELHSTSEELETSLEELHSVNEELKILNNDLEDKVEKLSRANNDFKNLIEAIDIGILFVDRDFCVQMYTSRMTDIFNLIPTDLGRPIQHITSHLKYDSLKDDLQHVLENSDIVENLVNTRNNQYYSMTVRPYRSLEEEIEGIVITFVDVTQLKDAEERLKQHKKQESLAALGMYALERHDLDQVMYRAIQQVCLILEIDFTSLFTIDREKNVFKLSAHTGKKVKDGNIGNSEKLDIGFAFSSEEPVYVKNYREEKRFRLPPGFSRSGITSGLHIRIRGVDETYGVLTLYSKNIREFSKPEVNFLQIVANMIGMTIDRNEAKSSLEKTNRRLEKEIRKSEQYQREILNASVAERWKLGSYLHDNLAQMLASVKIMLTDTKIQASDESEDEINKINEVIRILDEGMEGIRDLTDDIIPIDIEEEGVVHAFKFLIRQTEKLYKINCRLETDDSLDHISNRTLATNMYHVVQEAIKNATVHGDAKNIDISIFRSDGVLVMKIHDDGTGLLGSTVRKSGNGLRIMKYRMELLGGTFDIQKAEKNVKNAKGSNKRENNKGTVVKCTIPFRDLYKENEAEAN
jgi:two-component system, chemotaxis family, CheB/CheR fusion protein